jgi:hypothetical protein
MHAFNGGTSRGAKVFAWSAKLLATAVAGLLILVMFTESGNGPQGPREWAYLAFFPVGFSIGYLLGWWRPLLGGVVAIACMVASHFAIGRTYDAHAYLIWAVLCIPGVMLIAVGLIERNPS